MSLQTRAMRQAAKREMPNDVSRSKASCMVAVIFIKGQRTRGGCHVRGWSAGIIWKARQHFLPLTISDENRESYSPIHQEAKH